MNDAAADDQPTSNVEIYNTAPAPASTGVGSPISAGVESTSYFSSGWMMMWVLGVYYCSTVASIDWF
jgi:hypothetical protein